VAVALGLARRDTPDCGDAGGNAITVVHELGVLRARLLATLQLKKGARCRLPH
jgi:hypothetical protein